MPGGDWNEIIASCAKKAGLKFLCSSKLGLNVPSTNLFNLKRIPIKGNTSGSDVLRYSNYNITKEFLKSKLYQLPKRILGMKRYSHFRRCVLGEKSSNTIEIYKP